MHSIALFAQTTDKELNRLINSVLLLRSSEMTQYKAVEQTLNKDSQWTRMDELGPLKTNECKPSDKVSTFKLNRMLWSLEKSRKYVSTHGDFLNGNDSHYNYSLFERSVKAGTTVQHTLKMREGKQTFAVIPFEKLNEELSVSISCNKNNFSQEMVTPDGYMIFEGYCKSTDDEITITVNNKGKNNLSFVIINHNSRKK